MNPLEVTYSTKLFWKLFRMLTFEIPGLCLNMGDLGSKTKSPGEILGTPCEHLIPYFWLNDPEIWYLSHTGYAGFKLFHIIVKPRARSRSKFLLDGLEDCTLKATVLTWCFLKIERNICFDISCKCKFIWSKKMFVIVYSGKCNRPTWLSRYT